MGEDRRLQVEGWEGNSLSPSPCVCPPPLRPAGWWQKSIAALTLLVLTPSPPPSSRIRLCVRGGRSIRSQLPPADADTARPAQGWRSG